ncbi:nuclease-related domain-containing protein [Virgibacillus sp. W0181]|uniref:nuclease-related domain-containing protein n=1 Tax=Virgibacillus sp. W0181 TaxID=3391581 RepID=UPI003F467CD6
MIVIPRTKPHIILAYEALFRRLKKSHQNNEHLRNEYARFYAGFIGEKRVDYKLSLYPNNDLYLFYGLRLKHSEHYFQIDTLILTPSFICIVEIKNLKGTVIYDSLQKQLIQQVDGKEIGFSDPVLQAETQKWNLNNWLQQFDINLPIETIVVSSHPSSIIKHVHNNPSYYNKFIHFDNLPTQLNERKKQFSQKKLNKPSIDRLIDLIIQHNDPLYADLLAKYQITANHLMQGIVCENCGFYPMRRLFRKWGCPKCNYSDKHSHKQLLFDFFLLYKDTITNLEYRELLQISSPHTAYNLLKPMNLHTTGENKGRKYYAPSLNHFPQDSDFPQKKKLFPLIMNSTVFS